MQHNYAYRACRSSAKSLRAGWAMAVALVLLLAGQAAAQTYNLPTTGNTAITTCAGTLYDNGGPNGNYSTNADGSVTITPATAGSKVRLTFNTFAIGYYDRLSIYDGSSTSAPLIGTFYDYYSPGTVYATTSAGTLTVRFATDYYSSGYSGFAADIACVTNVPQPDLVIQGASATPISAVPGTTLSVYSSIYNLSGTAATSSNVGYYLSTDATLDAADVLLGNSPGGNLSVGGYSTRSAYVQLPLNTTAGAYYLLFAADYLNAVGESNETNNVTSVYLNVVPPTIDLVIQQPSVTPTNTSPGNVLGLACAINNQGNATASNSSVGFYLSTNTSLGTDDILLTSAYGGQLTANYPSYRNVTTTVPPGTTPGTYYILFVADYQSIVSESSETNNVASVALTVAAPNVDLIVSQASLSTYSLSAGTMVGAAATVYNQGNTTAASSNVGYYLSSDATLSSGDVLLNNTTGGALSSGVSNYPSTNVTIPAATAPGTYYILFAADYLNAVTESNETNNVRSVAIAVVAPSVDLVIQSAYLNSTSTTAGTTISASHYIYNQGNSTAASSNVGYYLSTNTSLGTDDILLTSTTGNALAASSYASRYPTMTIPANTAAGSYYILFVADYQSAVTETNENNNVTAVALQLVAPGVDLTIQSAYLNNTSTTAGTIISGSHYIVNLGNSTAASSNVGYYLSTNTSLGTDDILLTSTTGGALTASNYATRYPTMTIPANTATGSYYILFVADYQSAVTETNENNNVTVLSLQIVAPSVDLTIQSPYLSTYSTTAGTTISANHYIVNQGNSTAASSNVGYYLSTNTSLGTDDILLTSTTGGALTAGDYATRYPSFTIPANTATGSYYILFVADYQSAVAETNENNNVAAVAMSVVAPGVDLTIQSVSLNNTSVVAGGNTSASHYIVNQGNSTAASSNVGYYLSTNTSLGTDDILLTSTTGGALTAGDYATRYPSFTIPANTAAGSYYILFVADYQSAVTETNENNNVAAATLSVIAAGIDLVPIQAALSRYSTTAGTQLTASANIINQGTTTASSSDLGYYLSTDPTWSSNDVLLATSIGYTIYAGGYEYRSATLTIPAATATGSYYVLFVADNRALVNETNESNNVTSTTLTVTAPFNGTLVPFSGTASITSCGTTIADHGGSSAYSDNANGSLTINPATTGSKVRLTFTAFELEDCCDRVNIYDGASTNSPLIGSYAYNPGPITATNTSGTLTVQFVTDGSVVYSGFEATVSCVSTTTALPDLIVQTPTQSLTSVAAGTTIGFGGTVRNQGAGDASSSALGYYLSLNTTLDGGDLLLGTSSGGVLVAGASVQKAGVFSIPTGVVPGTYYVIYAADPNAVVTETSETNNTSALTLTVVAALPDLIVSQPTLNPSAARAGSTVSASCLLTNAGTAAAAQSTMGFYLSTDNVFSSNDVLLNTVTAAALPVSTGLTRSASLTIPAATTAGSYYVLYVADAQGAVTESNEQNNVNSLPFTVTVTTAAQEQLSGFTLSVYPNPASGGEFAVRMDGPSTGKVAQLALYNSIGQQVSQQTLTLTANRAPVRFDTKTLGTGVYMLRITGDDLNVTRRIVIE